jgi:protein-tyrosine-phosphatase
MEAAAAGSDTAPHAGESADARMTAAAIKRGVCLTSRSRPLRPDDLQRFDYIIGMDNKNLRAMEARNPSFYLPGDCSRVSNAW